MFSKLVPKVLNSEINTDHVLNNRAITSSCRPGLSSFNNWSNTTHHVSLCSNGIISNEVSLFDLSNSICKINHSLFSQSFAYCFSNFNVYHFSCLPPLWHHELLEHHVPLFLVTKKKRKSVNDGWKNKKEWINWLMN